MTNNAYYISTIRFDAKSTYCQLHIYMNLNVEMLELIKYECWCKGNLHKPAKVMSCVVLNTSSSVVCYIYHKIIKPISVLIDSNKIFILE